MFDGFSARTIDGEGAKINLVIGGGGPPVLLLHGYPQTHCCWHKVAPLLAENFTVVAADLRGYGDSDKPPGDDRHETYSKRRMAGDQIRVMKQLGFDRFFVAGHDRGGRVAHRMALDHPQSVARLAVLDIAPTREMYRRTDQRFATAYFHWFFLIQPYDFPERLIGADPEFYLRSALFGRFGASMESSPVTPEAWSEYLRCFRDPAAIHASCEDYRASASIDIEHDDADADKKIPSPLLVLWGAKGLLAKCYDVRALWRLRTNPVREVPLPGGHYLPEELPHRVAEALAEFFLEA